MKKTRNLESYVQWFNRLSYFVATEVCKVLFLNKIKRWLLNYYVYLSKLLAELFISYEKRKISLIRCTKLTSVV